MYVPTRRKRKGEGSGRSGAGSGWYKQTQDEFLGNKKNRAILTDSPILLQVRSIKILFNFDSLP